MGLVFEEVDLATEGGPGDEKRRIYKKGDKYENDLDEEIVINSGVRGADFQAYGVSGIVVDDNGVVLYDSLYEEPEQEEKQEQAQKNTVLGKSNTATSEDATVETDGGASNLEEASSEFPKEILVDEEEVISDFSKFELSEFEDLFDDKLSKLPTSAWFKQEIGDGKSKDQIANALQNAYQEPW